MKLFLPCPSLGYNTSKTKGALLLALALVLGSGPFIPRPAVADEGHGHSTTGTPTTNPHESIDHSHEMLEIPAGQPVPTVAITVHPDPVSGWNLELQTTNFRFTPENVNQANQSNEGHAHLYINGEKISRVYSNWLHLPSLPSGHNEITVGLNANNHAALAHNGSPIESTVTVEVP